MAKKTERLSTAEFSKLTGVPSSTLTKLIRDGKLKAVKESGKWMIAKSQSSLKAVQQHTSTAQPAASKKAAAKKAPKAPAAKKSKPAAPKKPEPVSTSYATYSVSEFSKMTYLTDFGVTEWLKAGRLNGSVDDSGEWRVDVSSLDLPPVKRLIRQ